MTPSNEEMAEHLLSCFEAIYLVLGESAPRMLDDAYVIRSYEMARAYGELALTTRSYLGDVEVPPMALLEGVLRFAVEADASGAMAMFAMSMAVGPRLLVSLLDARDAMADDPSLLEILERASLVGVAQIRAVGDAVSKRPPIEDLTWQTTARDLVNTLESAGSAESLGISR